MIGYVSSGFVVAIIADITRRETPREPVIPVAIFCLAFVANIASIMLRGSFMTWVELFIFLMVCYLPLSED